jgi:general stress protein YciG
VPERSKRGFAAMDQTKQRAIASLGGRAAHAQGRAHEFTAEEARAAGRKGGQTVREKYGPDFYATIGRVGGGARRVRRQSGAGAEDRVAERPVASGNARRSTPRPPTTTPPASSAAEDAASV